MEERASSIRRSFTKTRPFSEMIAEMKPEPSDRIWGAAGIVVRRERRRKRRRGGGAMVLMFGGEEEQRRKAVWIRSVRIVSAISSAGISDFVWL